MAKTAGQRLATQRYNARNYDRIAVMCPKGKREEYQQAAKKLGISFAELVRRGVEEYISRHICE